MLRLRWAAGLLLVAIVLGPLPGVAAYAAERPGSYAAEPSPGDSLAGSRAGVGRTPPGRTLPSPAETGPAVPPPADRPTVPASPTPRTERPDPARQTVIARGSGPLLVNVLPLGTGLLLTGLGLAFLALRLRR